MAARAKRIALAASAFLLTGLGITIGFERWALVTGRWQYDTRMPVVFGVGVTPLLQWIVIPLLSLVLFRQMWREANGTPDFEERRRG